MVSKTILTRVYETLEPIVEQSQPMSLFRLWVSLSFNHPQRFHLLISSLWSLVQPLVDHNNHPPIDCHRSIPQSVINIYFTHHIPHFAFQTQVVFKLTWALWVWGDKKYQFIFNILIWLYTTCIFVVHVIHIITCTKSYG